MAKIASVEIFLQPSKRITHWHGNYQLLHPGSPFQSQRGKALLKTSKKPSRMDALLRSDAGKGCQTELGFAVTSVFTSAQGQVAVGHCLAQ